MLGADKVPQSLLSDRFCRSGSTERWREPWDRFDGTLDVWLKTINELRLPVPVPVQSFRSNRCGISVVNEASGWVVAWDERFFDYVLLQLQLLRHESEQAVRWPLFRWLIQYVGEGYAVSDPLLRDKSLACGDLRSVQRGRKPDRGIAGFPRYT